MGLKFLPGFDVGGQTIFRHWMRAEEIPDTADPARSQGRMQMVEIMHQPNGGLGRISIEMGPGILRMGKQMHAVSIGFNRM